MVLVVRQTAVRLKGRGSEAVRKRLSPAGQPALLTFNVQITTVKLLCIVSLKLATSRMT
jgi:hypothetical protein